MAYFMIAAIYAGSNLIGIRLFDTAAKAKQTKVMDVKVSNIKSVILSKKAKIENLELDEHGELQGTNGIIDRYTRLKIPGNQPVGQTPIVITSIMRLADTNEAIGYEVVDYQGQTRKLKTEDAIKLVKQFGIANGRVVSKNGLEFIATIVGDYPVTPITKSKMGGAKLDIQIGLPTGKRSGGDLVKHTKAEVNVEVENSDVFMSLNATQRQAIRNYYIWYTVDAFYRLAKGIRLNVPPSKVEKLAELRGESKWIFAGIEDKYFMGGAHCELGHALRYAYYAVPEDEKDDPDARIIFGETCSGDFFDISPEDMKKLIKVRTIMSEEIKNFSNIVTNHLEGESFEKLNLLYQVVDILQRQGELELVFGNKIASAMKSFMIAKLPFPQSLVKLSTQKIKSFGIENFYSKLFKNIRRETLSKILNNQTRNDFLSGMQEYLNFIATNKIEGGYAYDPYDKEHRHRDEGAYNKSTRASRASLLSKIRRKMGGTKFTWDELYEAMDTVSILEDRYPVLLDMVAKAGGNLGDIADYFYKGFMALSGYKVSQNYLDDVNAVRSLMYYGLEPSIIRARYGCNVASQISTTGFVRTYSSVHELHKTVERLKVDLVLQRGLDEILRVVKSQKNIEQANESVGRSADEQTKEQAARKQLRDEAIAAEKKRDEARRVFREQAEREAKEKAQRRADKKAADAGHPDEVDGPRLLEVLKEMIGTTVIPTDNYGIRVSKDILSRKVPWEGLTRSQRWRLQNTYKELTESSSTGDNQKVDEVPASTSGEASKVLDSSDNNTYLLSEHPEIESDVDLIIQASRDKDPRIEQVYKVSHYAVRIAYSVKKYQKVSDKQLKHIRKAVEILSSGG